MTLAGTGHLVTIVCTESGGARYRERRGQCHGCVRSNQPQLAVCYSYGVVEVDHSSSIWCLVAEFNISDIKSATCRTERKLTNVIYVR